MNKKTGLAAALVLLSSSVFVQSSSAEVEFSANIAMQSDYRFRGWSQTDTSPAVQGGFDMSHSSGFYAGAWASNVDFAKSMELDYYGGFVTELADGVSLDLGYIYYDYPGSPDQDDFQEVYGKLSVNDFTIGLQYSDDFYLESGEAYYLFADYSISLPQDFSLALHLGHNDFDRSSSNANASEVVFLGDNASSYLEYSVGVSKAFAGIELGLTWVDTDLNQAECGGSSNNCDGALVFSISKSM